MTDYTPQAWRFTGYYPESYAKHTAALGIGIDYDESDYDRYEAQFRADLAAHDAEVRKAALEEAIEALRLTGDGFLPNPHLDFEVSATRAIRALASPVAPETETP